MSIEDAQEAARLLKLRTEYKDLKDKILRLHKEQKFDELANIAIELTYECVRQIEREINKI